MVTSILGGSTNPTLAAALAYVAAGLSVIPIRPDGSKAPRFKDWREFSDRRPTTAELYRRFTRGDSGVAVTAGPASGHLVVFDFEAWHAFTRWGAFLDDRDCGLLARCPVVRTPSGGAHVYLRLTESVRGSKYAKGAAGKCLIETRGNGHCAVAPGSPPECHPTGRPYRFLRRGWLDGGPFDPIPVETFHALTVHAAALNEYRRPAPREVVGDRHCPTDPGDRPGDHFNARVTWTEILTPHKWTVFRSSPGVTYWCRPEKHPPGVSASTGFCRGPSDNDLLYVFSTSAAPFEPEVGYSRFAAYTLLNHGGDFRAATRALGLAGYGTPTRRKGVRA